MTRTWCASAAIGCCAVTSLARADVLYSNFGPDDTYNVNAGDTLAYGGPLGGEQHEAAVAFIVDGADYFLDAAEVAVLHFWGPDLVHVRLHADDGGVPGQILEATTASGVATPGVWSPPMLATFSGDLLLTQGARYWLALATEETDALLAWSQNVIGDFGLRASRLNQGPWVPWEGIPERAVFRVHGTVVPSPGAGGGLLLILLAGRARRRR